MVYKIGVQTSKFLLLFFIFLGGVLEVSFQLLRLLWAGNRLGTIYKFNLMFFRFVVEKWLEDWASGDGSDSGDVCVAGCWIVFPVRKR